MHWKYAMILVDIDSSDPDDIQETCELVELYDLDGNGYTSFCKTKLISPKDIELAAKNIANDGINIHPIKCGGDELINQVREQWTDGANYFAIKPGVIIGYECNNFTIEALTNAGYTCINSNEFLNNPWTSLLNISIVLSILSCNSPINKGP